MTLFHRLFIRHFVISVAAVSALGLILVPGQLEYFSLNEHCIVLLGPMNVDVCGDLF